MAINFNKEKKINLNFLSRKAEQYDFSDMIHKYMTKDNKFEIKINSKIGIQKFDFGKYHEQALFGFNGSGKSTIYGNLRTIFNRVNSYSLTEDNVNKIVDTSIKNDKPFFIMSTFKIGKDELHFCGSSEDRVYDFFVIKEDKTDQYRIISKFNNEGTDLIFVEASERPTYRSISIPKFVPKVKKIRERLMFADEHIYKDMSIINKLMSMNSIENVTQYIANLFDDFASTNNIDYNSSDFLKLIDLNQTFLDYSNVNWTNTRWLRNSKKQHKMFYPPVWCWFKDNWPNVEKNYFANIFLENNSEERMDRVTFAIYGIRLLDAMLMSEVSEDKKFKIKLTQSDTGTLMTNDLSWKNKSRNRSFLSVPPHGIRISESNGEKYIDDLIESIPEYIRNINKLWKEKESFYDNYKNLFKKTGLSMYYTVDIDSYGVIKHYDLTGGLAKFSTGQIKVLNLINSLSYTFAFKGGMTFIILDDISDATDIYIRDELAQMIIEIDEKTVNSKIVRKIVFTHDTDFFDYYYLNRKKKDKYIDFSIIKRNYYSGETTMKSIDKGLKVMSHEMLAFQSLLKVLEYLKESPKNIDIYHPHVRVIKEWVIGNLGKEYFETNLSNDNPFWNTLNHRTHLCSVATTTLENQIQIDKIDGFIKQLCNKLPGKFKR